MAIFVQVRLCGDGRLARPAAQRRPVRLLTRCSPSAKTKLLIEQKISGSLALLHRQRGDPMLYMKLHHHLQINRADRVDIVQNERLVQTAGVLVVK